MGGYCIRIGAGKVNKNRLARFSRHIRAERGERCERCGREGSVELHHFWEKHIYPMLACEPDNVALLCPVCHERATRVQRNFPDFGGEFYSGFPVEKQKRIAEFRERAQKILEETCPIGGPPATEMNT